MINKGFHVTITDNETGTTVCDNECLAVALSFVAKHGGETLMCVQCGQEKLLTLISLISQIREEATELFARELGEDLCAERNEKIPLEKLKELVDEYVTEEMLTRMERRRLK